MTCDYWEDIPDIDIHVKDFVQEEEEVNECRIMLKMLKNTILKTTVKIITMKRILKKIGEILSQMRVLSNNQALKILLVSLELYFLL